MLQRPLLARGRCEARQRQQLLAPFVILPDPFLDDRTERVPYLGEGFRLLFAQAFQFTDHAAGHGLADLRELRIVLQHLPGNIERQILAVDHAADEPEITRQQIGIIGNEYAADVELHVALAGRLEQIERFGRWRKQQHGVGLAPFGAIMQGHRGIVEGAGDRAVALRVIFRLQLRFGPLPQGACRIDLPRLAFLQLQLDGKLDVVGISADDPLDLVGFQIFFRVRLQMQDDLGPALQALGILIARRRDVEPVSAR